MLSFMHAQHIFFHQGDDLFVDLEPYMKEVAAQVGYLYFIVSEGARCSSAVRAFAHGAMGRRIDPSWGGPIELFLVPASATRLV